MKDLTSEISAQISFLLVPPPPILQLQFLLSFSRLLRSFIRDGISRHCYIMYRFTFHSGSISLWLKCINLKIIPFICRSLSWGMNKYFTVVVVNRILLAVSNQQQSNGNNRINYTEKTMRRWNNINIYTKFTT